MNRINKQELYESERNHNFFDNYFFFLPFPFFFPFASPPSPSSAGDINFFRFLPSGVFSYLDYHFNFIRIDSIHRVKLDLIPSS